MTKINFKKIVTSAFFIPFISALLGVIVGVCLTRFIPLSENAKVKNFYEDEMAVAVSPTTVKKMIDNKDDSYILVDLRSAGEYNAEHFITAINIPAVSMNTEELVTAFKALPKDKEIIVHCYSAYCTLGRQVGKTLAENGVFVKELNIGWSELRYHWDLWNPGAKVTDGASYIIKGSPAPASKISPCVEGQFGC